jgi:hypothetical protein
LGFRYGGASVAKEADDTVALSKDVTSEECRASSSQSFGQLSRSVGKSSSTSMKQRLKVLEGFCGVCNASFSQFDNHLSKFCSESDMAQQELRLAGANASLLDGYLDKTAARFIKCLNKLNKQFSNMPFVRWLGGLNGFLGCGNSVDNNRTSSPYWHRAYSFKLSNYSYSYKSRFTEPAGHNYKLSFLLDEAYEFNLNSNFNLKQVQLAALN